MSVSKPWDWETEICPIWLKPSEESFYVANDWKEKKIGKILDFGCGLGRHSIFFSQQGFHVSAFDLSKAATDYLEAWAKRENIAVNIANADMMDLPYADNSFDGVFAYHVISHTNSTGIRQIVNEITRVLKKGGEIFISLCSKETWSFKDAGYPKLDENTIIKTDDGPEKGIPHFYVDINDLLELFDDYQIERIRHVDDCYFDGQIRNSKHYFVSAKLKTK